VHRLRLRDPPQVRQERRGRQRGHRLALG
jgi:hypothetical protein